MGLFDKFAKLAAERASLCDSQIHPFGIRIDEMYSPTEGLIQGQRVILAGTNNYLGLTFDPASIKAAQRSLELEGTGTTGSRMANGSYAGHSALEEELVDFLGRRSVIVFSTGYVANLAVIGTLAGAREVVLLDADCHASIYDACKLGGAEVIRFRHNDAADLERRMVRLGDRAREAIILVEGIYSMLGDQAPLREIVDVKRRLGGYLLVDEAHSFGVLGANGRGLAEELDVDSEVDILLGTFSKSLGAVGGFAACHDAQMDLLRYASRPYIFTASPSPSAIASVRSALLAIKNRPQLRSQLWSNARRLYQGLEESGYQLGPQVSPVIAVMLKSPHEGLALWRALMEKGVYVNLVLPPATPGAITLVRCSVSAAHTVGQIDHIIEAFASLRDPTGPVVAGA